MMFSSIFIRAESNDVLGPENSARLSSVSTSLKYSPGLQLIT